MRRSHILAASGAGIAWLGLQWLRWPEPPGLDQSLFVTYGHWLDRGLVLYRDLWDSKPPGLFALYALAEGVAGTHAPRLLDALAAAVAAALASVLVLRSAGGTRATEAGTAGGTEATAAGAPGAPATFVAATAAACLAAFVWSAPPFGGPIVAGQAEVLLAPLALGAALLARRGGRGAGVLAGVLLGCAVSFKLVALVLLPLPWIFAPRAARRDAARGACVLAGVALPLAACAAVLAAQGALGEAVRAVCVYPRAYAAEIVSRMPLGPALGRGAERFWRGLPLLLLLAAAGAALPPRRAPVGACLLWLGLAALGVAAQRQMASYHLALLLPPLVLLAATGVARLAGMAPRLWRRASRGDARALAVSLPLLLVLALAGATELRLWRTHYAPHVALRAGRIDAATFLQRLGGPGPAWAEAEALVRLGPRGDGDGVAPAGGRDALLVWGLAPAVYALAGCRPATRYAFHQTLLVEDSPLSRRWPDARARRAELLSELHDAPPRWVVIVAGDRSGLEPQDSRAELQSFSELAQWLAAHCVTRGTTAHYELLESAAPPPGPPR